MHLAIRNALACLSALALCCSLVPVAALAQEAPSTKSAASPWVSDQAIDEMLKAGEYAEGEAIVVMNPSASSDGAIRSRSASPLDRAESLMDVSTEAYEEATAESAPASPETNAAAPSARSRSASAPETSQDLSIVLVKQENMTTEDLLRELAQDPRVVSAEPNYLIELPREEAAAITTARTSAANKDEDASPLADLSDYQWAGRNDGERLTTSNAGHPTQQDFDINDDAWTAAKGAGWKSAAPNASGTVAVLDTGIDYTHPDLKNVMWNGESLVDLAGEGGPYGLNVSGSGEPDDVMDRHAHGTHCAGIIASSWDDSGTSGVANGVRLVAVKMLDDQGYGTLDMELRAYDYLARIATTVNLKAINNSWGGSAPYLAFSLAVAELGRLGAVTVIATGNNAFDTDQNLFTSATLATNPYAVAVNSSDATGRLSAFSNYGAYTTDLAAPGSCILSTVPASTQHYFPETSPSNIQGAYETFASGSPSCTTASAGRDEATRSSIGSADFALHYDESPSWSIKIADMDEVPSEELANMAIANGTNASRAFAFDLSVNVPEDQRSDARKMERFALKCLNAGFSMENTGKMFVGVWGVETLDSNGTVQLATNEGLGRMSGRARMVDSWEPLSLDLEQLLKDSGSTGVAFDDAGNMTLRMVVLLPYDPNADDAVNLDCIGVGSSEGSVGSYDIINGTSMAAPMATGAAAVLARDETPSATTLAQDGAQTLAASAAERAARLKGSTAPASAFSKTCRSDGALDLGLDEGAYTPSVVKAESTDDQRAIVVQGFFFGDDGAQGALSIDGTPATIASWSDNEVIVERPSGRQSGKADILLTAANGKATRYRAALTFSDDDPTPPLYEKELASPASIDAFMREDAVSFSSAALDGSLYLLTLGKGLQAKGLWRYDISHNAWSRCADLPEALTCSNSAITALGDSIMLSGTADNSKGRMQLLYRYSPESNTWEQSPYDEQALLSSIASWKGLLLLAGGVDQTGADAGVRTYDPQTGEIAHVADLPVATTLPSLAASNNSLTIAQGLSTSDEAQPGLLMRGIESNGTWSIEKQDNVLPADAPYNASRGNYGLASYAEGVAVVGLAEPGYDTALLPEGATKLQPFAKTLSQSAVYQATATAHDGYLYALAVSNLESERIVFRATAIDTGSEADTGGGEGSAPGDETKNQGAGTSEGTAAKPLASTGDGTAATASAAGMVGLTALLVGAFARTRTRRTARD